MYSIYLFKASSLTIKLPYLQEESILNLIIIIQADLWRYTSKGVYLLKCKFLSSLLHCFRYGSSCYRNLARFVLQVDLFHPLRRMTELCVGMKG